LADHLTDHQLALDLGQAGFGGQAHARIGLDVGFEQVFQTCPGQRVAGLTEQPNSGQAHVGTAVHQLQIGQRKVQR